LRTFLHVVEKPNSAPEVEHPFQGWLPYLKLVWQPSVQLLEVFSSAANLAITEPCAGAGADGVWVVGDVGRDATVFAVLAGLCGLATGLCGLATCLGASIVTLGSWVCEIAVPHAPHNNAVDRTATAEGATKLNDNLMTMSLPNPGRDARPDAHGITHSLPRVENISANDFRHSGHEVDRIATAEGATRLDDILMTRSPKSGNERRPGADTVSGIQPAVPFGRHHAPAQSHASPTLATMRSVEPFSPQPIEYDSFARVGKAF
jgi:hypothetical protein